MLAEMETGAIAPVYVWMDGNLAVADVHRDFKAETHFGNFWLGPHDRSP